MPARQYSVIDARSAGWRVVSLKRVICSWSAGFFGRQCGLVLEGKGGGNWELTGLSLLELAEEVLFQIWI